MKMKKLLFSLFVLAGIAFSLPTLAATTIILSPASVSVTAGQSFNVAVNVDPQAVRNYTVKVALSFPADLLEVDSFTFGASGWMAWNQPGYDLVDNTNGALIKTAGYPGGFSSAAAFGTVSFKAKAAGTAVIQTGSATLALDGASQNVFSGSSQTNVTIVAVNPPIPPAQVLPPKPFRQKLRLTSRLASSRPPQRLKASRWLNKHLAPLSSKPSRAPRFLPALPIS